MGLIVSAISYNGEIVFSFTGCREITPDPEKLSACALASFRALKKAAAAKTAKSGPKTKAKKKKARKKTARRKAS